MCRDLPPAELGIEPWIADGAEIKTECIGNTNPDPPALSGAYDYTTVHWPGESAKLLVGPKPAIFVSDLYLPSQSGDRTPTSAERDAAKDAAKKIGERFSNLYASGSQDDKARLQETMKAIADAYAMLKLQWSALRQSTDYGVAVLARVKAQYPEVPFVFYSRKITPEDVIRVLKAGAIDAIQKGALTKDEVLTRLETAQETRDTVRDGQRS
jgi:DNA-binding NarL/FixJ family response regulator